MVSMQLPTDRSDPGDLDFQIGAVARHPVATGLLRAANGLVAIVNQKHEIVSLNDAFLSELGIRDPAEVLGLKPGEALDCRYAAEGAKGCGSSDHCASCGAAIALVTALATDGPIERRCALSSQRDGVPRDFAFSVRAHPILIAQKRFILLFLRDITRQQQRAALTRSFYHDLNNVLTGLNGACELLEFEGGSPDTVEQVVTATRRLTREIEIQRHLFLDDRGELDSRRQTVTLENLLEELETLVARHPAARNRLLEFPPLKPELSLRTDLSLCLRVLSNMVVNALEASDEGGLVLVRTYRTEEDLVFAVWNSQPIPTQNQPRIFQRNFSTKEESGRGFGTYSMKLFAEKYLGGSVEFSSSRRDGTEFRLILPFEAPN
jgi:signal transduction histidine kinase